MNKNEMNSYYKNMIVEEDIAARQVGWRDDLAQSRRFEQLSKLLPINTNSDVADLGCGLGDLYEYLNKNNFKCNYSGYDLSLEMIDGAKRKYSELENKFLKIEKTEDIKEHDYILLSGIFNMKRDINADEWYKYILTQLDIINNKSKKGFAFNMLTSYSDKEFMRPELFYPDPCDLFRYCKENFSKNIALLHDYEEYDFTILVRK